MCGVCVCMCVCVCACACVCVFLPHLCKYRYALNFYVRWGGGGGGQLVPARFSNA